MNLFLQKGWTLTDFSIEKRVCPLQETRPTAVFSRSDLNRRPGQRPSRGSEAERSDLNGFFLSLKLSPGLSNQPKPPIYPFWQSLSQIANLPQLL